MVVIREGRLRLINTARRSQLRMGASAIALLALAVAAPALAQEAAPVPQDDTAVDEIVVTGIRASLASAQSIKQNSEQFVDSITAVDIGRLPDVNVAEALQRVSGIQITRTYGEGSGIAIRGLTNVRSELNGRDIFSASGGRGLSWEEIGSDLLGGVDVYKNPSAEMIEGGLGGSINLKTRLPFDAPGRVISASVSGTHYGLADDDGYSISGLISDRFDTGIGEIGVMLNASYAETSFREDKAVVEPYFDRTDVPGFVGQHVAVPNGGGFSVGFGDRKRTSIAFATQWRPNDKLDVTFQVLRADYDFRDNGLSFFAYGGGTPLTYAPNATFAVEDGISTKGSFINPGVDAVTFSSGRKTDTTDISLGGKWQATDRLKISADLQYIDSNVRQETMNLTASAKNASDGAAGFTNNWNFTYDTTGKVPAFGDPSGFLSDINNYGLTAVLPYRERNDATSWAGRADLQWDFDDGGFFQDFRAGVRATDKSAINRSTTYGTWTAVGQTCANWSGNCIKLSQVASSAAIFPFRKSFLNGEGSNVFSGDVWMWGLNQVRDPKAVFDLLAASPINQPTSFRSFDDPAAQTSNISENTYATYGMLRFGSEVGGMEWDGNAGVRVVKTESTSTGYETLSYRDPAGAPGSSNVTIVTPIDVSNKYTKVLPSINLRLHVNDKLQMRFAASRNMARPDFGQLNASFSISPSYPSGSQTPLPDPNVPGTGTATGNPELNPQMVDAFDVSAEYYFSKVGFVYATAFKKDIKDLIVTTNYLETHDLPGVGNVTFNILRPSNVDKGELKGFEIGGQRFFDFLPGAFSGLGVQANYTYIDSNATTIAANAQTGGAAIAVPIQGLSKNSYNLIVLYEKYGINARLAYNWRDDYLQGTSNTGTGQLPIFGKAYGVLDASISYDFNPQFAVTLDAQNLLKQEFKTYQIEEARLRDYQADDRRFSIRLRVRY
jgi:TonB-dependent receptor